MRIFRLIAVFLVVSGSAVRAGDPAPKNLIFMISDGQCFNHVDAAGLYEHGETGRQVYEQFPVRLAVSTYSASGHGYDPEQARAKDYLRDGYTDSAASATAFSTGVQTLNGYVGVDPAGERLLHLADRMEDLGKATGMVTSVQLSHATPAGFSAHHISRKDYTGIARQMILESRLDILMGCGHPWYDHSGRLKDEGEFKYVGGDSL